MISPPTTGYAVWLLIHWFVLDTFSDMQGYRKVISADRLAMKWQQGQRLLLSLADIYPATRCAIQELKCRWKCRRQCCTVDGNGT
jgi:hypothetical protein